jgi:outer membrane protein assembly factor BamD (BamD/ComL family)
MAAKKKKASPLLSERHEAALEEYEKGIRLLQQKDYSKAALRFRAVLEEYPAEAALGDRARTYLRVADGEASRRRPLTESKDPAEAYEIGVFLLNDGDFKGALRHLERAAEHRGGDEGVLIALASAQLQSGDRAAAVATLDKLIEKEPEARYRVRLMSDFEALSDDDGFRQRVLEG